MQTKKFLSLLLALAMMFSLTVTASAAEEVGSMVTTLGFIKSLTCIMKTPLRQNLVNPSLPKGVQFYS